jgi:hypothetical protein
MQGQRHRRDLLLWIFLAIAAFIATTAEGSAHPTSHLLRSDLNGDSRPDAALQTISGSTVKIKIKLSGQRTPIRLSANVTYEPTVSLSAYDVDNDKDVDLILTNSLSVIPVAVWLNQHNGSFKEAHGWITGFPIHRAGSRFIHRVYLFYGHAAVECANSSLSLPHSTDLTFTVYDCGRTASLHRSIVSPRKSRHCTERAPPPVA